MRGICRELCTTVDVGAGGREGHGLSGKYVQKVLDIELVHS